MVPTLFRQDTLHVILVLMTQFPPKILKFCSTWINDCDYTWMFSRIMAWCFQYKQDVGVKWKRLWTSQCLFSMGSAVNTGVNTYRRVWLQMQYVYLLCVYIHFYALTIPYLNVRTLSITSLASWIGLALLRTADTAPLPSVFPSITMASISTSPLTFSTDPHPEIRLEKQSDRVLPLGTKNLLCAQVTFGLWVELEESSRSI